MSKNETKSKTKVERTELKTREITDGHKRIKLLVSENPKRPGTASHARFALYKDGMTLAEALAAGVRRADFKWDQDHEFIRIDDPQAS